MLEIRERVKQGEVSVALILPFEDRQRSRLRVTLSSGEDAALLLPRGTVLRGGDVLRMSDGRHARVVAAPEAVSTVRTQNALALARVAYHLGNRHVPVEVGDGFLRYLHDHVLDDMVHELGLHVQEESSPFEPESGAYASAHRGAHGHHHGEGGHAHALLPRIQLTHAPHPHGDHGHSHDE